MRRMAFAGVLALVFSASTARAEPILLVQGVPATYTPGEAFTFTLRVPEIPGLSGYSVRMTFNTDANTAPLLAFPTQATPGTGSHSYVFASNARFGYDFSTPVGDGKAILTISDPIDPDNGPNPSRSTRPGQNVTLATITVMPFAQLTGPISLTFLTDFQYNESEAPPYDNLDTFIINQGSAPEPVPAPPAVVLLGIGGLTFAMRWRLARN